LICDFQRLSFGDFQKRRYAFFLFAPFPTNRRWWIPNGPPTVREIAIRFTVLPSLLAPSADSTVEIDVDQIERRLAAVFEVTVLVIVAIVIADAGF
jgi:hypothetical protein